MIRDLIERSPDVFAWVSFSCRDGERISDGTPITECAALFEKQDRVVAVGMNCTAPEYIPSLIDRLRESSHQPIIVYPYSGEAWDATRRAWTGTSDPTGFATMAREWRDRGARLIGGCCRIGPQHIREMSAALRTFRH